MSENEKEIEVSQLYRLELVDSEGKIRGFLTAIPKNVVKVKLIFKENGK